MDRTRAERAKSLTHPQPASALIGKFEEVERVLASSVQWKATWELLSPLLQKAEEKLKVAISEYLCFLWSFQVQYGSWWKAFRKWCLR